MAYYKSMSHLPRWLVIATLVPAFSISATSQQSAVTGVIYRCKGADEVTLYTSKPSRGCVVVSPYRAEANRPTAMPASGTYQCTSDCSGHRAGYEWARNRSIADPNQCSGNSNSFIEGCRAFTEGHPGF